MRYAYRTRKGGWHLSGKGASHLSRLFRLLGGLPRLERQHVDAVRLYQPLELVGRSGQNRKCAVVHRHDLPNAEQPGCDRGAGRTHREMIADWKKRDFWLVKFGDQPHVAEHIRVAGEVERLLVLHPHDEAGGLAEIDIRVVLHDAAGVDGRNHRDVETRDVHGPSDAHALDVRQSLSLEP